MRLLIIVNVDWFFLSHRLPIALAALSAGHEVHVATNLVKDANQLRSYGFVVHPLEIDRSGLGLWRSIKLILGLWKLLWSLRPDVLHLVTIKPVLLGGIAARFAPVGGVVYAISGLGHVFVAQGLLSRVRRLLVKALYRFVLGAKNMRIIFQNPDDQHAIATVASLPSEKVVMIPGSGVDLARYHYTPLPADGVPVVMMAARLLATKGVREFVEAATLLKKEGVHAKFWLVGDLDPANPASIMQAELETWEQQSNVEVLGHRSDIFHVMAQTNIVVLPSYYGEGLPKVLIEAAASGRAIITTDMPGCRDAIEKDVTGLLVPARDVNALAEAIRGLLDDPAKCAAMGAAGRQRAEQIFDVRSVVQTHLDIYEALRISR